MTAELPKKRILGYPDRVSVAPGEDIRFMVSCDGVQRYRADIVRLVSGDLHPGGSGFIERLVETPVGGDYPGRDQPIDAGSYAVIDDAAPFAALESFTLQAMIWPTTPDKGRQTIMGNWSEADRKGFAMVLDGTGALALDIGDGARETVTTGVPLLAREWTLVAASFDAATKTVRLVQQTRASYPRSTLAAEAEVAVAVGRAGASGAPFTIADGLFNGKIDAPRVSRAALDRAAIEALVAPGGPLPERVVAAWDFAREMTSVRIVDTSPNRLDGRLVNLPARAMTGHNWTGDEMNWRHAPEQYGAIHFHDDDLYDCGWDADFTLTVPERLPSGVYAARLVSGDDTDHIPFAVLPPRGAATADALFLMPTASYMAYANEHNGPEGGRGMQVSMNHLMGLSASDLLLDARPELSHSLYDKHSDGSGVCYSSRLRPILNFRPGVTNPWVGAAGTAAWQFNADTPLLDWLEAKGFAFDVATDEDLHAEGAALLQRYRVVLTGSHPEYYSTAMWDAVKAYTDGPGRLMYLGGNGFYWRIAYHETLPGVLELRRAEDGIRDWVAEPGEYYHSFTGEYGGLWTRLGRPVQSLVGIGMAGQGFDVSGYFRRTEASRDPRAAFIFEGVDDEVIGDFGTIGGGAAGIEVDRHDRKLGSPPHALIVATSEGLSDSYYPGPEDINSAASNMDATQNPGVRADMVFFETAGGGAVFSTGSISWIGSLTHDGHDNNVSTVTANVLRRFLDPAPFA